MTEQEEFEFRLRAEQEAKAAMPPTSAETTGAKRESVASGQTLRVGPFDTGYQMPQWATEGLAGAGRRLTDIGTLGMREKGPQDALLDQSLAATVGGVGADLAVILAGGKALQGVGQIAGKAIPAVGRAMTAAGQALYAPQTAAQAFVAPAAYTAATTGGDVGERAFAGGVGGLGGVLGYKAAGALGSAMAPKGSDAQTLFEKGIRVTPGQRVGGFAGTAEEALSSVPYVGDVIGSARRRSMEDFNRAAINEALKPIGINFKSNAPIGREGIAAANEAIGRNYDRVLSFATGRIDNDFQTAINAAKQGLTIADEAKLGQFDRIMVNTLKKLQPNQNGVVAGPALKTAQSNLSQLANQFGKSANADDKILSDALYQVRGAITDMAKRHSAPGIAEAIDKTDEAYSLFSRIADASTRRIVGATTDDVSGMFTPGDLLQTIKQSAGQSSKALARGEKPLQQFAEQSQRVIGNRLPDSGTARRAMQAGSVAGLAAFLEPTVGLPALGLATMYTPAGIAAANAAATMRPGFVRQAGLLAPNVAPALGVSGGLLGAQYAR